jgi:hypothetical protein
MRRIKSVLALMCAIGGLTPLGLSNELVNSDLSFDTLKVEKKWTVAVTGNLWLIPPQKERSSTSFTYDYSFSIRRRLLKNLSYSANLGLYHENIFFSTTPQPYRSLSLTVQPVITTFDFPIRNNLYGFITGIIRSDFILSKNGKPIDHLNFFPKAASIFGVGTKKFELGVSYMFGSASPRSLAGIPINFLGLNVSMKI